MGQEFQSPGRLKSDRRVFAKLLRPAAKEWRELSALHLLMDRCRVFPIAVRRNILHLDNLFASRIAGRYPAPICARELPKLDRQGGQLRSGIIGSLRLEYASLRIEHECTRLLHSKYSRFVDNEYPLGAERLLVSHWLGSQLGISASSKQR